MSDGGEYGYPGQDPTYQELLMQWLMGQQGGGMQIPLPGFEGVTTQPSLYPSQVDNLYGVVDPSLNPTQQGNFLQDYLDIMSDNALGALAGAGAFGADTFAPTTTYERVPTPGRDRLMRYVTESPGTIEAYLAEQILGGGTASSAWQELRQAYEVNPTDPEIASFIGQLPLKRNTTTGEFEPDWNKALDNAMALEEIYMSDPQVGQSAAIIDPQTGEIISPAEDIRTMMDENGNPVLVRVESEEAPMAEWFRERGYSLPTDQFEPEDFLDADWQQGQFRHAEVAEEYRRGWDEYKTALAEMARQSEFPSAEADLQNILEGGIMASGGTFSPTGRRGQATQDASSLQPPGQWGPWTDPEVIGPLSEQLTAEGHDLPPHWTYEINPDGSIGEPLPPEYQAGGGGGQGRRRGLRQTGEDGDQTPSTTGPYTPEQLRQGAVYQFLEGSDPTTATEYINRNHLDFSQTDQLQINLWFADNTPPTDTTSPPASEQAIIASHRYDPLSGGSANPGDRPVPESEPPFNPRDYMGDFSGQFNLEAASAPSATAPSTTTGSTNGTANIRYNPLSGGSANTGLPSRGAQLRFLQEETQEAGRQIDERRRGRQPQRPSRARYAQANRRQYGADYGTAVAVAHLLGQAGITPLQQEQAVRRQAVIGMGLSGSGYIPGVG